MAKVLVEICIESVDDAHAAAGVDRLELCQALAVGGLTPSAGVQKEVRDVTSIPLMIMMRPRPGGFCYSDGEFRVMRRNIDAAIELGANGIVFGVLTESGTIDRVRAAEIVHQVRSVGRPLEVVFHRAFDFTPEPFEALEQLIEVGVTRVLTSGQQPTAPEGASIIRRLVELAAGRIQILAGSGIHPDNVREIVDQTGCGQVHASLRRSVADLSISRRAIPLAGGTSASRDSDHTTTDRELVRSLLSSLGR